MHIIKNKQQQIEYTNCALSAVLEHLRTRMIMNILHGVSGTTTRPAPPINKPT